jgi:hypothetical protein
VCSVQPDGRCFRPVVHSLSSRARLAVQRAWSSRAPRWPPTLDAATRSGASICTATDLSGNTASASETGTLVDDVAPAISAGAPVVVFTSSCGGCDTGSVNPTAIALDAFDGALPVSCSPDPLVINGPGTVTATCTATDSSGNSASAVFSLTLVDDTPPTITCNAATFALNQSSANVTAVATDGQSGPASQSLRLRPTPRRRVPGRSRSARLTPQATRPHRAVRTASVATPSAASWRP